MREKVTFNFVYSFIYFYRIHSTKKASPFSFNGCYLPSFLQVGGSNHDKIQFTHIVPQSEGETEK